MNNDSNLDNFAFLTEILLAPLSQLPTPLKEPIEKKLRELLDLIENSRPPRFMLMGRRGSGKSTLINAIFNAQISQVGAVKSTTGKTEWQEYDHDGEKIEILDTRGFQEGDQPEEDDDASTPTESIITAIQECCPDAILFLCKAEDVDSAIQADLDILESIIKEIHKIHAIKPAIMGIVTQCDKLEPSDILNLPTDDEEKNQNINQAVEIFKKHLFSRDYLQEHLVDVVPTAGFVRYRQDGTQDDNRDYRWNIDHLTDLLVKELPKEAQFGFARLAKVQKYQKQIAGSVVSLSVMACGLLGANPIPGVELPVISAIETFMIAAIGYIAGRKLSLDTATDFLVTAGIGVGTTAGIKAIASSVLKLLPGAGSAISGVAAATATKGIGDAAIAFFIDQSPTEVVRGKMNLE